MSRTSDGPTSGDWKQLLLDAARTRYVDVERIDDDRNIPDMVDVKSGNARAQSRNMTGNPGGNVGGWTPLKMAGVAGVGLVGLILLKKAF